MATQSFNAALLDLVPDTLVELFEIDLGEQDGVLRFHSGSISNQNIVFDGNIYLTSVIDAKGFEKSGDGKMPRPTVSIANINGLISDIIKNRNDLVGCYFTRKRVFLKFIDAVNFPNNFNPFAIPDPDSRYPDEHYIVNKKLSEHKVMVDFELISPLEYEGARLPARTMLAKHCPWIYRGKGCRYGAVGWAPNKNIAKDDAEADVNIENFFGDYGHLGFPVADEKDVLIFESSGYNIKRAVFVGDYDNLNISKTVDTVTNVSGSIYTLDLTGAATVQRNIFKNRSVVITDTISGNYVARGILTEDASYSSTSLSVKILNGTPSTGSVQYTVRFVYTKGDVVKIKNKIKVKAKITALTLPVDLSDKPDFFFVCLKDSYVISGNSVTFSDLTTTDARYAHTYWVADKCSKSIEGCKLRWEHYGARTEDKNKGLPFGGFPSIDSYNF